MDEANYTVAYFVEDPWSGLIPLKLRPDEGEADAIAFRDKFHPGCSLFKQELWHKYTEVV